jgi:ABC-type amino acid transport substrate-binding protein
MFKKGFIVFMLTPIFVFLSEGISCAQMKSYVFGGVKDFVPYEYLDTNETPAGFNVELIRAIARTKGWDVEIRLLEWSSAIEALRKGTIDAFLGMLFSEERDREFDFSDPHSNVEFAFFTHNDAPPINSLEDLRGRKIGLHELETSLKMLKDREGFRPVIFKDLKELFTALDREKVDAAFSPKMMGLYWIQKLNIANVSLQDNLIFLRQYCFSVREGNTTLIGQLNEGLEKLKQSGEYFHLGKVLFEGVKREAPLDPFFLFASLLLLTFILLLTLSLARGRRSIQGKLTLAFLGISMIPLSIIGVLTYFNERGIIKNKVGNQLASTADLKATLLGQRLSEAKSACRAIANDLVLVDSLLSIFPRISEEGPPGAGQSLEKERVQALRAHLQGLVKGWGYDEALIIRPNGIVVISTYPVYEGINMAGNPHFMGAMRALPREVHIKDLYYSQRTKNLRIAFSTTIHPLKSNGDSPPSKRRR